MTIITRGWQKSEFHFTTNRTLANSHPCRQTPPISEFFSDPYCYCYCYCYCCCCCCCCCCYRYRYCCCCCYRYCYCHRLPKLKSRLFDVFSRALWAADSTYVVYATACVYREMYGKITEVVVSERQRLQITSLNGVGMASNSAQETSKRHIWGR